MKITMAQLNYTVGDIDGNLNKITEAYQKVENEDGLLVCSELALTGYYPQDLVYQHGFVEKQLKALSKLQTITRGKPCGIVVGYIARNLSDVGKPIFNALAVLEDGKQIFEYHKKLLPTYNVFDEYRHFKAGNTESVFEYKDYKIGVAICEDIWAKTSYLNYPIDPIEQLENQNIDLLISINASPSNLGKQQGRFDVIASTAKRVNAPIVYVNQVGGNDELVFDGASLIVDREGKVLSSLASFEEEMKSIELNETQPGNFKPICDQELRFRQTVLGIRDYIQKCGFSKVVVGSSGGIDSAVTLAICAEALGNENVTAITMPSKFSSKGSVDDSVKLCNNLGVKLLTASIGEEYEIAVNRFVRMTGEKPSKITKENIQARIRGRILMEFSNQYGALVVSTGNKSEMSVGYATLYGDMNGGVNPLGDLYKMEVYALAEYFNQKVGREIVPQAIIDKAPSAELSEDQ
ncbi:MAG: NAD+ synthase, partial [Kangiellaceae bacterium]|nr:NAD+ synthase [Kangiellaceae bacterium]